MSELRTATAADHESVDQAFGGFDLGDRDGYGRFLTAHARALPAVESALAGSDVLPAMRARTPLLQADLTGLGLPVPAPLPFAVEGGEAGLFGAAYVIEGSRLGGGLLSRRIPADLPSAYLSATHLSGEWRDFLTALETRSGGDAAWIAAAAASARATFALYRTASAA